MEEKGTCCANKGECMGSMCYKKHMYKKIFMIVAMVFMFWFGLQLGELRTLSRMMERHERYGYGMMNQGEGVIWDAQQAKPGAVELQATPATPEKTTTPATK